MNDSITLLNICLFPGYETLLKDKIKEKVKIFRPFYVSGWYTLVLFLGACLAVFTGEEVLGTYILAIITAFSMTVGEDLLPALQGIVTISCFAIRCKYSLPEFLHLWPLSLPVFVFFFSHFYLYPKKLERTSVFWGMAATSVTCITGGWGIIYWKTYFSPTSLFYMCSLGFGMVIIYMYLCSSLRADRGYDFEDRFSRIMTSVIPTVCVSLAYEYISRYDEFIRAMSVIPFQWRNNGATLLMLAMPFAFGLSVKKYRYFFVGLLSFAAIVFTGSRGGLIFGAAELALCILTVTVIDKKHRKYSIITICAALAALGVASRYLMDILRYTIERMLDPKENSIRLDLYKRGINDFKDNPVFGRGLAYMGNRDVHASAKHTLCWYHCTLIQIPASMGIAGIAAHGFLTYKRIRVFADSISFFSLIMFLSFVGLEMMSLVNPGIFVPFPYLLLVTVYFICMEKCNTGDKTTITKLFRGE